MWPLLLRSSKRSSPGLGPFSFPVVYVAGELDCLYGRSVATRSSVSSSSSRSVAEVMEASCPEVRIAIVPGCGHAVPTEAPGPLYREVARAARAATVADTADSRDDPPEHEDRCSSSPEVKQESEEGTGAPGELLVLGSPNQEVEAVGRRGEGGIRGVGAGVSITGFHLEEFSVPMIAPVELSLCRLTERRGWLVRLEGEKEEVLASSGCQGRRVWGVGGVTPLPGFHKETLEEAARQLRTVAPLLVNSVASFKEDIPPALHQQPPQPPLLLQLLLPSDPSRARGLETAADVTGDTGDGEIGVIPSAEDDDSPPSTSKGAGMTGVGEEVLLSSLLPSVRCGVEMALVHLVARASGRAIGSALSAACGFPARDSIEINDLATRGEEGLSSGGRDTPRRVLKVKVGGRDGPTKDAGRILKLLRESPRGSTIRLDANLAWTMDGALGFLSAIAEADGATHSQDQEAAAAAAIEYIEEPLRNPRALAEFWKRSGKAVRYALDESLAMGREIFTDEVRIRQREKSRYACSVARE